ncbi:uncharacterized protein LOC131617731 [Vicia villosa]|uniref:uncharacterized protein LOC131617731 n=1 Tax=Vicia villosa TaxID=3911 RepID=UPI00273BCC19|nr:uncharacterized protein LOC131617731 [Vicia villosa]
MFQSNLKFLLSFSLLCVLFSLLFQSLKPFLMQYYYSFYTIDKSYMFLLSNTLLAFIALCSTIFNTSSSTTHESIEHVLVLDSDKSNHFEFYVTEPDITEAIDSDNILKTETPKEDEEEKSLMIVEQENMITEAEAEEEEEEEEEEEDDVLMIIEEYETDELNKKCEDFIKKMKAKFCYDSYVEKSNYYNDHQNQSSLVLVN